ncbi:MAG: hypothetical protein MUF68_00130 [Cyclobacteriaceae bacterium]|jgi:hypothetical protein|nr:hypothetical protein [Cyclobacteriaceae bacterium]
MKAKPILATLVLLFCFFAIAILFWQQEVQYALPTPVPSNFKPVYSGQKINLEQIGIKATNKPKLFHFFNPDCPCSRFNLAHVKSLLRKHKTEFDFYAIIPAYADLDKAKKYFTDLPITVLQDNAQQSLTSAFGVYATPQAVVLTTNATVFYKGNYNKARYCTQKESNYAQIAMQALLAGKQPPVFNAMATTAYGCTLPSTLNK